MKTIGVIGLGSIGMRHAHNLIAMGHRVIGYDPTEERGKMLHKLGGTPLGVEEFVMTDKDGVIIASPTRLHVLHLHLKYVCQPVLVEKPMGLTAADADTLQEELRFHRPFMVGNNLRFHDCVQKAKEWLPLIGKPLWANFTVAQYNDKPEYLRDGVTLNWGAHEVDLALHLLGPAEVVAASISKNDDIADILLLHESGCRTTVHLDYLTDPEVRAFIIHGNERRIGVDLTHGYANISDTNFSAGHNWNETYMREMQAFLVRIDGVTGDPGASGEDGLNCLKLLLDAKKKAGL